MNRPRRIGVYGGTFDPVHGVHLDVARAALQQAGLDEVLFVVSAAPPHKRHGVHARAEDRLAMVEAALTEAGDPRLKASRIELDRPGPSYTADTLRDLHALNPGAELFLIIGADALRDLPGWREPDLILARAKLLAVPRPGFDPAAANTLDGHFQLLNFPAQDVSSTEIRARAASGSTLSGLVPAAVARIIEQRELYRGDSGTNP